MLKLKKNHTIFEIWNEWAAESVYIDHRPTRDEIVFIVKKEWGTVFRGNDQVLTVEEFIKKHILVEKERHVYTDAPVKTKKKPVPKLSFEPAKVCNRCMGSGMMADDSYDRYACPWCNGNGIQ